MIEISIIPMTLPVEPEAERECVHYRLVDAPRERVYRALATPGHLSNGWGPNGFSSTFQTFDFQPGGKWVFVVHGPDGTDYPNENEFVEINPAQCVVIEHISDSHHFFLTITFKSIGDRTLVGWRQLFDTKDHKRQIANIVEVANEQNLDRLEAVVRNDC